MTVNASHFLHTFWALSFMTLIGLTTGNWIAGAAFGSAFFIGREHSQAELRWLQKNHIKIDSEGYESMPELADLYPVVWKDQVDAWLDWIVPTVACCTAATVIELYGTSMLQLITPGR